MTCYEKDFFSYYIILAFSKAALAQFGTALHRKCGLM